jgi:hypothetical protein
VDKAVCKLARYSAKKDLGMSLCHIQVDIILILLYTTSTKIELSQMLAQLDPESEGTTILRNIGNYLPKHTANVPEDYSNTDVRPSVSQSSISYV